MTKRLLFVVGVLLGVLIAEIIRRPKLQRLAMMDVVAAEEAERFAEYDRQWREEVAALPFEERMEVELWEAGMRLNNWMPDDTTWGDDDAETT